ncbi:MAG: hypothetical protein QOD61_1615 [Solirubrobacteraceae bacterium]|nr:hypothetical protein [Solirubrobacteraceae bacterium]
MGILARLRRVDAGPEVEGLPLLDTNLRVVRDDSSFTAEDGSTIRALGFALLDPIGEFTQPGEDDWLREAGCRLCKVAGLTHQPEAAQDARFAPGSVVVLAPDPKNPVDPHAVTIWDAKGELQVGFVPAELAESIAGRIAAGELLGGVILREYRTEAPDDRRVGLVMLIAPMGKVTLRVEAQPGAAATEAEAEVGDAGEDPS